MSEDVDTNLAKINDITDYQKILVNQIVQYQQNT
jgi:hypothetical protein